MKKMIRSLSWFFCGLVLSLCWSQASFADAKSCLRVLAEAELAYPGNNVLLQPSRYLGGAIPYDQVSPQQIFAAILNGLSEAEVKLKAIAENPEPPTYKNTVEALETLTDSMEVARSVLGNFKSVRITPEIQIIESEVDPLVSKIFTEIPFNPLLFKRVEQLYNQRNRLGLPLEEKTILVGLYKQFETNGARLDRSSQKRLSEISERMVDRTNKFKNNIVATMNAFDLHIADAKRLDGIPESALKDAAEMAKNKGHSAGWSFSLNVSVRLALLKHAKDRDLREEIWRASSRIGTSQAADNRPVLLEIAQLRLERARILGFRSHADFTLKDRMAGSLETVNGFLDRLASAYKGKAVEELAELEAFAGMKLMPWDTTFYAERLQEQRFQFKEEELKPYFSYDKVLQGAFYAAGRLYGVSFVRRKDIPVWDSAVQVYEVKDRNGKYLALFYADPYQRRTKRPNAAWMDNLLAAGVVNGVYRRPHTINATNFTPPSEGRPSLLTPQEVTTVFHELGHGLHGMLTKIRNRSISGPATEWDAVELPSQIFEKWAFQPEVLAVYAHHWETGEVIPTALVEKLKQSQNFMLGVIGIRQIMLGKLDLAWNSLDVSHLKPEDVEGWEAKHVDAYLPLPRSGAVQATSFAHIFSGGYAAGYYGYKWADVLAADGFGLFEQNGIFDAKTAKLFRVHVLEAGQRRSAAQNYLRFRGRNPDPDALLKAEGIPPKGP